MKQLNDKKEKTKTKTKTKRRRHSVYHKTQEKCPQKKGRGFLTLVELLFARTQTS